MSWINTKELVGVREWTMWKKQGEYWGRNAFWLKKKEVGRGGPTEITLSQEGTLKIGGLLRELSNGRGNLSPAGRVFLWTLRIGWDFWSGGAFGHGEGSNQRTGYSGKVNSALVGEKNLYVGVETFHKESQGKEKA